MDYEEAKKIYEKYRDIVAFSEKLLDDLYNKREELRKLLSRQQINLLVRLVTIDVDQQKLELKNARREAEDKQSGIVSEWFRKNDTCKSSLPQEPILLPI